MIISYYRIIQLLIILRKNKVMSLPALDVYHFFIVLNSELFQLNLF